MYAKIFHQIYDGTLGDNWQALITFQQLLILSDHEGYVDMTPSAIHRITGIPLEIIELGIKKLIEPDPKSRSSDHEGRRLIPIDPDRDWGWIVVNKQKYARIANHEEKKEKDRIRIAEKRFQNRTGSIYFIASQSLDKVKIGFSKNPWARLNELQQGNHTKLSVVATIKTTESSEFKISNLFQAYKLEGEWYNGTIEILNLIKELKVGTLKNCDDVVAYISHNRLIPEPTVVATIKTVDIYDKDENIAKNLIKSQVSPDVADVAYINIDINKDINTSTLKHLSENLKIPHRFAFEDIWKQCPPKMRVGKKAAEKHFHRSVKTEDDYRTIQLALKNYLKSERVQKGYIQNGSTWFNNWRDWVPDESNSPPPETETLRMVNEKLQKNWNSEVEARWS